MAWNLLFISMFGERDQYDPVNYRSICSSGLEKDWIVTWHGGAAERSGFSMTAVDICRGGVLPEAGLVDCVILGGTMHVIDEEREWLGRLKDWLAAYRKTARPLLAVCGGHQLLSTRLADGRLVGRRSGTLAGTSDIRLTERGRSHALFSGLGPTARFHFANYLDVEPSPAQRERVLAVDDESEGLAIDHGGHWYSTQFHPESRKATWACTYGASHPEWIDAYDDEHDGAVVIDNFLKLAASARTSAGRARSVEASRPAGHGG